MNINLTLLGQMITFALFVWFTMAFVWPPIMEAIKTREKKIADGLAAAEKGEEALMLAEHRANDQIREAKAQAVEILERANKRGDQIVTEAREDAKTQGVELINAAKADIVTAENKAMEALRRDAVRLSVLGAEQVLASEIDAAKHEALLNQLIEELSA